MANMIKQKDSYHISPYMMISNSQQTINSQFLERQSTINWPVTYYGQLHLVARTMHVEIYKHFTEKFSEKNTQTSNVDGTVAIKRIKYFLQRECQLQLIDSRKKTLFHIVWTRQIFIIFFSPLASVKIMFDYASNNNNTQNKRFGKTIEVNSFGCQTKNEVDEKVYQAIDYV